ncbi:MAG: hypothetical protein E7048_01470 [Lentisphaerae bacterium]|nr:hypothetical protein [Lentisphaerota bacterium]
MQIIFLTLAIFLFPGIVFGNSFNLLPEWENTVVKKESSYLSQWRFADWGVRNDPLRSILRQHKAEIKDGKLFVTLESTVSPRSANMLLRTLSLKNDRERLYRFSIKARNAQAGKALLRLKLSASKPHSASREFCFTADSREQTFSAELQVPPQSKTLSVQICLSGPGKLILSQACLTVSDPPENKTVLQLKVPSETFFLPERSPVLFPVKLPANRPQTADAFITVTLPWGVRLINTSPQLTGENIHLKRGEYTEIKLKLPAKRSLPGNCAYLLLGSDLSAGAAVSTGSVRYEDPRGKSEKFFFRIQTVKDHSVLPPRFFKIILDGYERLPSLEAGNDAANALLRSGANILQAPHLPLLRRTLKNARIGHWSYFYIPQAPAQQHCYYAMLRNESFWEKHFIPALHRQILRRQSSAIEALICDNFLGQKRSIECVCSLCRAEFADFAPKLPRQAVMNYSSGLLNSRFSKELRNFRHARLLALFEAARIHLPVNSSSFVRTPRLIPCYPSGQVLSQNISFLPSTETIIDFRNGPELPDGVHYNGAVNLVIYEKIRRQMNRTLPRRKIMAKYTPLPARIGADELKFEILNILFSGFSGVWIPLPPGTSCRYNEAIAETAALIREYENFFRRSQKQKIKWNLTHGNVPLELPPLPDAGLFRMETPDRIPGMQLRSWKYGSKTLVGIGNFTPQPRICTLSASTLPADYQVEIDQKKYSGKDLSATGVELTVPPYSWKFLEFPGL